MPDTQRRKCKRCQDGTPHEWKHGTFGGYRYHGCRCGVCKSFVREHSVDRYWTDREYHLACKRRQRERNLPAERVRERAKAKKPETLATSRRRQEKLSRIPVTRSRKWMPHERALVLREDLSVVELAYMLGRSASSVQAQRCWLRNADVIRERNRQWREQNYDWYAEHRRVKNGITQRGQRTTCKRGHPYDKENTYWNQGTRYCKTCRTKTPAPPRAPKTHCPQGHAYDAENTRLVQGRYKTCMQCDRDKHRKDVCAKGHDLRAAITDGAGRRRCQECKAAVTHCNRGHEFTPENTRLHRGARHCRACRREDKRSYRLRLQTRNAA